MATTKTDEEHFRRGETENPRFWSRFGGKPDLRGARVLDVGCGWGSLCIDMALEGAGQVVGLDLKRRLIQFAGGHLERHYPQLSGTVTFQALDLKDYGDAQFDVIVAKDSFEHIIDLSGMLREMRRRLAPGGRIYAGFGPLYTSPYGDHDRRREILRPWGIPGRIASAVPWGHLVLERAMLRAYNRTATRKAASIRDLGLNGLALSGYLRAIQESGLALADLRLNQGGGFRKLLFSLLSRLPLLSEYCTINMYCVLEHPRRADGGAALAATGATEERAGGRG